MTKPVDPPAIAGVTANSALIRELAKYARYHRDKRNILTHFVGIPLIVFAAFVLLARLGFNLAGVHIAGHWLAALAAVAYYLRLELKIGLVMAVQFAILGFAAQQLSATNAWLAWGVGLFVVGWVFQFIGHYYEGKKPAFVDDLIGLAIGPLFVTVEALFLLKLRPDLEQAIVQIAGSTYVRGA
jgi:uncharacterized membrane protein YGL010W